MGPKDYKTDSTRRTAMTTQVTTRIHTSTTNILRLALMASLTLAAPLLAIGQTGHDHDHDSSAKLVRLVREATRQFINVNNATAAGYGPAFGCVSGPDHGAMGIHYVNGALVGDGLINVSEP